MNLLSYFTNLLYEYRFINQHKYEYSFIKVFVAIFSQQKKKGSAKSNGDGNFGHPHRFSQFSLVLSEEKIPRVSSGGFENVN